jgi:hypothetical protein
VKDGDENMRKFCAQSNGTSIGMHHYLHDYLGNEQAFVCELQKTEFSDHFQYLSKMIIVQAFL